MKALIDTNCYSALMRGDEGVAQFLDDAEIVYLSTIVAGELMAIFKGGPMEKQSGMIKPPRKRCHFHRFSSLAKNRSPHDWMPLSCYV
jgi:hypothetical protein